MFIKRIIATMFDLAYKIEETITSAVKYYPISNTYLKLTFFLKGFFWLFELAHRLLFWLLTWFMLNGRFISN